jgi:gliding motility-associated-like protein
VITYPENGGSNVPVDGTISWTAVSGNNGYIISMGTAPGAVDILNRFNTGVANSYTAPTGLPENTLIYLSISVVPYDGPPKACPGITFTTEDVTTPPSCTQLIAPDNNAANVTIVTDLIWAYAPTATHYRLSIGTLPGVYDIFVSDVGNVLSYNPPFDLPNETLIFVRIIPINENGQNAMCTEESFSTGPPAYSCDPYVDALTGETIATKPLIEFPSLIGICSNELPYTVTTEDSADGFRWFRTIGGSGETLLSESREVHLSEPGRYRYEAYNNISVNGSNVECAETKLFTVVTSEIATIAAIHVLNTPPGKQITVEVSGLGNYEYALDAIDGPYQESPIFEQVLGGGHIAYVRDKSGCGIAQRTVDRDLNEKDFPMFFTPNGDGINDYWQFVPPPENYEMTLSIIAIYDRYGRVLAEVNPESMGWDGNSNGRPLPSSDYWFKAVTTDNIEIKGHFTLKR